MLIVKWLDLGCGCFEFFVLLFGLVICFWVFGVGGCGGKGCFEGFGGSLKCRC